MTAASAVDGTDVSGLEHLDTGPLAAATTAYHQAATLLRAAAEDLIKQAVLAVYPDAQAYVLQGDWNEDGEVRCNLDEVWTAGAGRCSVDDGNDAVAHINDAVEEALMWLDSEDDLGPTVRRIESDAVLIEGLDDDV